MRLLTNIAKTKHYKRNQIVFLEGEVYAGFYVVLSGAVKVYKLSRDGEEMVQNRLERFRSFAESSLFSGSHFYSACAQTMEDSSLLFFPRAEFESGTREKSRAGDKNFGSVCGQIDGDEPAIRFKWRRSPWESGTLPAE